MRTGRRRGARAWTPGREGGRSRESVRAHGRLYPLGIAARDRADRQARDRETPAPAVRYTEKRFGVGGRGRDPSVCEQRGGHAEPDRRGRCFMCGTKLDNDRQQLEEKHRQRRLRRDMKRAGLNPDSVADRLTFLLRGAQVEP